MATDNRQLPPAFLERFAQEVRALRKTGHFSDDWLLDGTYNHGGWLHGRLWGAMVRAVPEGFVPNLEVRLQTPGAAYGDSFKPDLVVCGRRDGRDDALCMVVELESTNSSDDRVVQRDIDRLRFLQEADDCPGTALLITTLPSSRVKYLPMYKGLAPNSPEEREKRRENPYAFHRKEILAALDALPRTKLSIAWANLDTDGVRLEYWNGRYERPRFWPTR